MPVSKPEGETPAPPGKTKRPPRRQISGPRKWLYRLAALTLIPLVFFGLLELSLWLTGFGDKTDFFLDGYQAEKQAVWIDNPDFGLWVFPRQLKPLPKPIPFVLPKFKAEGTCRIFVLGESAARGFPDSSTSFARVLEVMLRDRYPERRFEVINTSMVAINSHVALPIARQCVQQQPDLIIVHLGNNEVIGPFGAAGVLGPFSPRLSLIRANLWLKTTGTGQLFDRALQGVGSSQKSESWAGMAMFVNSQMRADDPRLPRIQSHFRENLHDICRAAQQAGAPVILCTIPVNLKDSAPFGSLHAAELPAARLQEWETHYQQGGRLEDERKFDEAVDAYVQAAVIDDTHADLLFRLARCYAALGEAAQAKQHYLLARDRDALRFRSDTAINQTIREVAAAREANQVRLADAEASFAASSPGAIPGEDLFLEHVHMTFKGNWLLARTVFETIAQHGLAGLPPAAADSAAPLSQQECADRLAYTEWSEWKFGTVIHEQLMQEPPFTFQLDHRERGERSQARLTAMHERLQKGGIQKALDVFKKAAEAADVDWMIRMNYAELLTECGSVAEAADQYEWALSRLRHNYSAHYQAGNLYLKMNDAGQAEAHFRDAQWLEPQKLEPRIGVAEALELRGQKAEALAMYEQLLQQNPNSGIALNALGRFLLRSGKLTEARARLSAALEKEPDNAAFLADLGMAALQQGNRKEAIDLFEAALQLQPVFPEVRAQLDAARGAPAKPPAPPKPGP